MIVVLTFIVGLLLGMMIASGILGYMYIDIMYVKLGEATDVIKANNEFLEAIEDRVIEVKEEA